MSLDKQRIAAVRTLEMMGYVWTGAGWSDPPTQQAPSEPPLGDADYARLSATLHRFFHCPANQIAPLLREIKEWGWFG